MPTNRIWIRDARPSIQRLRPGALPRARLGAEALVLRRQRLVRLGQLVHLALQLADAAAVRLEQPRCVAVGGRGRVGARRRRRRRRAALAVVADRARVRSRRRRAAAARAAHSAARRRGVLISAGCALVAAAEPRDLEVVLRVRARERDAVRRLGRVPEVPRAAQLVRAARPLAVREAVRLQRPPQRLPFAQLGARLAIHRSEERRRVVHGELAVAPPAARWQLRRLGVLLADPLPDCGLGVQHRPQGRDVP
mmetsp:Transcript_17168/g.60282  ORF Transcript_17168/g.60282 Transcript_17168/m.60282 type:complete len:252 (+) Transcript_17168:1951-2706(+)